MTIASPDPAQPSTILGMAEAAGLRFLWGDSFTAVIALPDGRGHLHVVRFPNGRCKVYRSAYGRDIEVEDDIEDPAEVVAVMRRMAGLT